MTRFSQPMVGLLGGVGSDAVSARMAHQLVEKKRNSPLSMSYPGGNSVFSRYLVAGLIPGSIRGGSDFNDIMTQSVDFGALDRRGASTRMRLGTTVIRVEHKNQDPWTKTVLISYEKGGKVYRVQARSVIMASGGWINKHIIADQPQEMRAAYEQFNHAPALIANVALHASIQTCLGTVQNLSFSVNHDPELMMV